MIDRTAKTRTVRIWFLWIAVAALVAGTLAAKSQDPRVGSNGKSLEGIELLKNASTVTLTIDAPDPPFDATVILRAVVGPDGCRVGRSVTLYRVTAGSIPDVPVRTISPTGTFGHAPFDNIPNEAGAQYYAIVADDVAGCAQATSNTVTLPGWP